MQMTSDDYAKRLKVKIVVPQDTKLTAYFGESIKIDKETGEKFFIVPAVGEFMDRHKAMAGWGWIVGQPFIDVSGMEVRGQTFVDVPAEPVEAPVKRKRPFPVPSIVNENVEGDIEEEILDE